MRQGWRARLAQTRFVREAMENPVDPALLRRKPSPRFFAGLAVIALSYLLAWPLITLLGIIAARRGRPEIFVVGSPAAYGLSTLVFLFGAWLAGKEGLKYMRAGFRWLVGRIGRRLLSSSRGPDAHR